MVDSPRYTRALTDAIDDLGGIDHVLLSHRDDVADADQWAERYGAQVWIHDADADAAPYATNITTSDQRIDDGVMSIHFPGHTKGHVVYHVDDRLLFTGDALFWNHRRHELDVTPKQTWYCWDALANSIDTIAGLNVEWVFPGHGKWHEIGQTLYATQVAQLGKAMRDTGQQAWSRRPYTSFAWY